MEYQKLSVNFVPFLFQIDLVHINPYLLYQFLFLDLTIGNWKTDVEARVQLFAEMREALENKSLMAAAIAVIPF